MSSLWEAFWFFLPAGIANIAPVISSRLPILMAWRTPLDFGRSYKGKRIFGENKTWRGLSFGIIAAVITGLLQYRGIASSSESIGYIILVTGMMGCGALVGDAVESFFKRRNGVPAGESWFPFDQTDYIIGGLLFVVPFVSLTATMVIQIFALYFGLHLIVSYVGFLLGLKNKPI